VLLWRSLPDLKQSLAKLLPGVRTYLVAWRSLAKFRAPHFRAGGLLRSSRLDVFTDRPVTETEEINANSEKYFEHPENREFWLNRPFSHPETVGKYLERFGLLLATLGIRPGDKVLDFGCGTGWTSIMLARTGAEVVGMDIAPAALDIGREAAERELTDDVRSRLTFETYSGDGIDIADGDVDFVVVFDAFHHFPNPMTILREFHRVLSPHGRFGFAEPGAGHATSESSIAEAEHGILEQDLDLEQFYRSAMAAGFQGLELAIPALPPEILTLPMQRMRSFLQGLPWIVPQDFLRKTVLTGPIGVFRKGAHPVTSLNPRTHLAEIRPVVSQVSSSVGEETRIVARVKNRTETVWLREGRRGSGYVRLGAHLLDEKRTMLDQDFGRTELPRDLTKGDSCTTEIVIRAPGKPGTYIVQLDMVNEGTCWFAQRGSPVADVRLDVQP